MEWMININRLTPEQRYFFETEFDATNRSNHWIQGPVGSGKTVVLVHTINKVFENNPNTNACIVVFTYALIDLLRTGLSDELKERIPIFTYPEFSTRNDNFDIIFVDEVQDIRASVLTHLRNHSTQLIVAGDSVQSIYDDGCLPDQISQLTNTRPYRLKTVHRLTNKIIQIASRYLHLPDLLLSAPRGRLANVDVVKFIATNSNDEVKYIYNKAKEFAEQGYSTAILLPKHDEIIRFLNIVCINEEIDQWTWSRSRRGRGSNVQEYNEFNYFVNSKGLPIQYLGNNYGSLQRAYDENLINVMTYHSSKGLDFQAVFLPFLSVNLEIWRDPVREKTLFFVALTRSRQNLFLSYSGFPHPLVDMIPQDLLMIEGNKSDTDEDLLYDKDNLPF